MMIFTVVVAMIVKSVIVKTEELQKQNAEHDEVIKKIEVETENTKQF